jgi:acetyl-CoA acetyltransferase
MDSKTLYILGVGATPVGKHIERSFTDLAREALSKALADAGGVDVHQHIGAAWFSNYMMDSWGQRASRGQMTLLPLVDEGLLPAGTPIVNTELGCAAGTVTFQSACDFVRANPLALGLAVGVEKMSPSDMAGTEATDWFVHGMAAAAGPLDDAYFWSPYQSLAAELGVHFEAGQDRSFAMDVYALWALSHMAQFGTTREHIAMAAAKSHNNAVLNPRARYRFPMTPEEVLADRTVSGPLTRAMCSPAADAGSAVLVCSGEFLKKQPPAVRSRAVRISGAAVVGGNRAATWFNGERSAERAAKKAYAAAGVTPQDIDVVELHDACSFAEVALVEDLGFCARGEGGPFIADGRGERKGPLAINASGGLVSRGHPIGATGILMLQEICLQLRQEAGDIQVDDARVGLIENGGSFAGHDTAACSVIVLERA